MIYLDYAATSPTDPQVVEAMVEELQYYGNPSSKYYKEALDAQNRLNKYRKDVASLLSASPSHIIFNSGATEGNNAVILGCFYNDPRKRHFITTNAEHKSVLETMRFIESLGAEVTYLPVSKECTIDPEDLKNAIKEDTNLVSIFYANNEVGSLNDIATCSKICKEKNVLFHTDATQAVGKIEINVIDLKVDFLTFSGHKIYGPKGVGALYVGTNKYGTRIKLKPLIHGGDQEFKLRAGTQCMHNIAGLAKACDLAKENIITYNTKVQDLENQLVEQLKEALSEKIIFFGHPTNRVPGIVSFAIEGLNNEMFLANYCDKVAISTGSACALGEPSHVLIAMGYTQYGSNVIRISLGTRSHLATLDLIGMLSDYLTHFVL